jgi:hypothetical protein
MLKHYKSENHRITCLINIQDNEVQIIMLLYNSWFERNYIFSGFIQLNLLILYIKLWKYIRIELINGKYNAIFGLRINENIYRIILK